jgi:hypothetical protein
LFRSKRFFQEFCGGRIHSVADTIIIGWLGISPELLVHFHNAADALRRPKTISYGCKAQFLSLTAAMALLTMSRGLAGDELIDPFLASRTPSLPTGSPTPASATSATIAPARGTKPLRDEAQRPAFLETVIQGRKETQMPAFGLRLSMHANCVEGSAVETP